MKNSQRRGLLRFHPGCKSSITSARGWLVHRCCAVQPLLAACHPVPQATETASTAWLPGPTRSAKQQLAKPLKQVQSCCVYAPFPYIHSLLCHHHNAQLHLQPSASLAPCATPVARHVTSTACMFACAVEQSSCRHACVCLCRRVR